MKPHPREAQEGKREDAQTSFKNRGHGFITKPCAWNFPPLAPDPGNLHRFVSGGLVPHPGNDSGFGTLEAVVESTEDVEPDVVALAFGWGDPSDERSVREKGCNVQRLIPDDVRYDPVTGLAQTTAIPVNIHPK